jgi:serine O-acetyltransferase
VLDSIRRDLCAAQKSQTNGAPSSRQHRGTTPRRVIERALEDVRTARARDPAARSAAEVVLAYPGVHALWIHALAHALYTRRRVTLARLVSHGGRFLTGIEIHPGAQIGRRVFIDHGMGVVIGETAEVGDDCLLYKGVVLGGTSLVRGKRHPTLHRGVTVGSNACILGPIEIGEGARVGAGSVVVKPVPAEATVVGVPGRIVRAVEPHHEPDLEHGKLPDPLTNELRTVVHAERALEERLRQVEEKLGIGSPQEAKEIDRLASELGGLFDEGGGV